mgnify:CR=1 FL=1
MKYYSLHKQSPIASFKEATILGQAPDKGLYFPESITPLKADFFENIEKYSLPEIAYQIASTLLKDEIPAADLKA